MQILGPSGIGRRRKELFMKSIMIVELLLGTALSLFPIGTAAQQPEHHPEQSPPKPPMLNALEQKRVIAG
jgi:hypothetical protein